MIDGSSCSSEPRPGTGGLRRRLRRVAFGQRDGLSSAQSRRAKPAALGNRVTRATGAAARRSSQRYRHLRRDRMRFPHNGAPSRARRRSAPVTLSAGLLSPLDARSSRQSSLLPRLTTSAAHCPTCHCSRRPRIVVTISVLTVARGGLPRARLLRPATFCLLVRSLLNGATLGRPRSERRLLVSQSATFFLLPANRFDDLVAVAAPQVVTTAVRHLLFLKRVSESISDDFMPFLRGAGRRGERCDFPGSFFLYFDFALEAHGFTLFQLARPDLSEAVSQKRVRPQIGSAKVPDWIKGPLRDSVPVFDHLTAAQALARLNSISSIETDLRGVAAENFPPDDQEAAFSTLQGVFELTKRWLASVRKEELGLLTVQ